MSETTFRGFPREAIDFYVELEADNTRAWWRANKARYERVVKGPMDALLAAVDAEFGPFRQFRPYQDTRFAKNRPPYKTQIGALSEGEGGRHYYVQFSAVGLMTGVGYFHMRTDQLTRYRDAVADDGRGRELGTLVDTAVAAGHRIGSIGELKTAPRGYAKDHPRIELLRHKGLALMRTWPVAAWLHTAKVQDRVVDAWREAAPVAQWLDAHVGPSTLPPDDFR
jgi:uncharacterized protein (TIGR02453 family)